MLVNLPPNQAWRFKNSRIGAMYPMPALLLIGTMLKQAGFNIVLIDGTCEENYKKAVIKSLDENPVYVGISVMTTQINMAMDISCLIKKRRLDIPVIWGGAHTSLYALQTMNSGLVDVAVINEGAHAAVELAMHYTEGSKRIQNIKGIAYRDTHTNVRLTEPRPVEDIRSLPQFDFSIINIKLYLDNKKNVFDREFRKQKYKQIRIMPLLTGLGCSYKCRFCINVILKRNYRYRSAREIVDEIKMLQKKYGANAFQFLDEDFFINKKRIYEFLYILEKENVRCLWRVWLRTSYFRKDYINNELMKRLEANGMVSAVMGAESGNDHMLNYLNKQIKVADILRSSEYTKGFKVTPRYSFMVGLPKETKSMVHDTVNVAIKIKTINPNSDIVFLPFRPYPGSPLFADYIEKYQIEIPDNIQNWRNLIGSLGYFIIDERKVKRSEFLHETYSPDLLEKLCWYMEMFNLVPGETTKVRRLAIWLLRKTANLRLKHFFLQLPIEYILVKKFVK